jgi:hypothetical protein
VFGAEPIADFGDTSAEVKKLSQYTTSVEKLKYYKVGEIGLGWLLNFSMFVGKSAAYHATFIERLSAGDAAITPVKRP